MNLRWTKVGSGALWGAVLAASVVQADVTGSYDGSVISKKSTETIAASAVFSVAGKAASGTLALPASLEALGGAYFVTGKATPKRLKVSGTGAEGTRIKYRAKIVGETLQGKVKVKGAGGKLRGKLVLTLNAASDGAGCDAVYAANEAFFVDEVLGQALQSCVSCHAPGLQAAATRLHVSMDDPLDTARWVAGLVDPISPPLSRILEKPLNVLPHGGGQQILPASPAEQILSQWAEMIAVAACD